MFRYRICLREQSVPFIRRGLTVTLGVEKAMERLIGIEQYVEVINRYNKMWSLLYL